MNGKPQRVLAVIVLSVLAPACADHGGPTSPAATPPSAFRTAVTCQATVSPATLTCGAATPLASRGIEPNVILGGQGKYVMLTSSGTAYNSGAQIFQTNVTVQNLIVQPMGTVDGTTLDTGGVKVFINNGFTVTMGSGVITPANNDGTQTFTQAGQDFWKYSQVLAPQATSSSKLWQFTVPTTVISFSFSVYVDAKLPADASVLLWTAVPSGTKRSLADVGRGPTGDYAVGDSGTILFNTGTGWGPVSTGLTLAKINLYGITVGGGSGLVDAVGDSGQIVYFDGTTWSRQTSGVKDTLFAVAHVGSGIPATFAVGAKGVILFSMDGISWTPQTSGTAADLYATGGSATNNWYAAGAGGVGLHFDGTTWSPLTSNTTADLHGATGSVNLMGMLTQIFVVGSGGTIILSTDGMTFNPLTSGTTQNLFSAGLRGPSDVFAVGDAGTILHYNGTAWSAMASPSTATLRSVRFSVFGMWAVGAGGVTLLGTR